MTLERSEIRRRLEELAEPGYRDFNCKLLPGVEDMLGVRTPALRRLAREIAKGDWRGYVDQVRTGSRVKPATKSACSGVWWWAPEPERGRKRPRTYGTLCL